MRRALETLVAPLTWLENFLFDHTPRIFLTDTFQACVALGFVLLGGLSIVALLGGAEPGVIGHALPSDVLRALWGASLMVGGIAQLGGLQVSSREIERFGMTLTMVGCAVYMVALFSFAATTAGLILGVLFLTYFAGYWIRLRASSRAKRMRAAG